MALNFTVSYTFAPSTTISSSQVNTNTSDVAAVFQGLEALTKTWAKLKMDADPTTALEVATKQYVDHYSAYRRPVLQYGSATVVNLETGITGTSGQAQVLFSDGTIRQDSTTGRINCNLAQVANLSGSWQSGLRTGSVANNTWYAIYAVKTSDDSSKFVTVADTVLPLQANFATLNTNFGTNSWVYLGMIRNGDNSGSATGVLLFTQYGNRTVFHNECTAQAANCNQRGIRMASAAGATSVTYTGATGTGAAQFPDHCNIGQYGGSVAGGVNATRAKITSQSSATLVYAFVLATAVTTFQAVLNSGEVRLTPGAIMTVDVSGTGPDIFLLSYIDNVLGVGANPLIAGL